MKTVFFASLTFCVLIVFMSCRRTGKDMTDYSGLALKLKLTSKSFKPDSAIPVKYTCDATTQVFPELSWNAADKAYKSFVIVMDDPDAVPVVGYVWEHWLVYDIPAGTSSIGEGSSTLGPLPTGTKRGLTSFGDTAYGGPCPPPGQLHHYHFKIYGLDVATAGLPSGSDRKQVMAAIKGHIMDSAELIGTYQH